MNIYDLKIYYIYYYMNHTISYKDALMKQPDKSFEVSKRSNILEYSRRDIKKICTSGDLNHLRMIPNKYFTEEIKSILIKLMNEKILEIEMWKCEDQNQFFDKVEEFDLRINNINLCIKYIESLI